MSWLEARTPDTRSWVLRLSRFRNDRWSDPVTVVGNGDLLVNWADFPSVTEVDGTVLVHWLQRGGSGGYDYGIRVSRSLDGGTTWSEPWTPHDDASATEHGFVSAFPVAERLGLVWLDGRRYARGAGGSEPTDEMTLRFRTLDRRGGAGPEILVDGRVCDCCQTDAALTAAGPVVVYRDRSPEEIRDIHVTRLVDGRWTGGVPVHEDGWHMEACPVNGPAVAARDRDVVVAWFTGA
ncbi:MAG TPA: hypothetical protein VE173_11350, partial [Longimicrobiales bacterium]|nr:hypothetical protein [Longimicrobiales bacterium]